MERLHRRDSELPPRTDAPDDEPLARPVPGKRTEVARLLDQLARGDGLDDAPGRRTLLDDTRAPGVGFEDYRVLGLRDVLLRLGADHPLCADTLAAADPAIARRAVLSDRRPPQPAAPGGHAMWRAAERHAVTLYRRAVDAGEVDEQDPAIAAALASRGSGQPLPPDVCGALEGELGIGLANVRVHTDAVAAEATRAARAEAFTVGDDIFFAPGAFAPETPAGRALLVHELAHVAQARSGRAGSSRGGIQVSSAGDSLEREAEAVAERVERNLRARALSDAVDPLGARALDAQLGERMSRLFGADLTKVAIHTASAAARGSTRAVAKAGAIHFRGDAYRPGTSSGDWLIAHELAHVVQQTVGAGERLGTRAELEREADRAASRVVRGLPAGVALRAPANEAYAFSDDEDHDTDVDRAEPANDEDHTSVPEADDRAEPAKLDAPADRDGAAGDATLDKTLGPPVAAEDAGGGGAPGGGGDAAKPDKPAPNVAGAKPEAGLAQLSGVRPDKLVPALGQLHTATATDVGTTRAERRANPPKQLSTGEAAGPKRAGAKAKDQDGEAAPAGKGAAAAAHADKPVKGEVPGGEAAKKDQQGEAAKQQRSAGQAVADAAQSIRSWFGAWSGGPGSGTASATSTDPSGMSETETRQMSTSLRQLPTGAGVSTDPGQAPQLAMKGEAKASADAERDKLEATSARLAQQGQTDSQVPMGEDSIETSVPTEELTAKLVPGGEAPGAEIPTLEGAGASEEAGIVAREQQGAEIDAAVGKASADVAAARSKHAQEEQKASTEADRQVRELKATADADQATARMQAKAEAEKARGEWRGEIDKKGAETRAQADKKVAEGMAQVEAEEAKANDEAKQHIEEGKQKADEEKQKGEREAEDAKKKGEEKSSGFFGWVSSKAKSFFDGIKKAISAAIDAAKKAVKAVLDAAKKLAMAAIELARKAITAAIKAIGDALIALSEVLLAAFPELKAKFQALIKKAVDAATAAVNKLAEGLKKAVQAALDKLGKVIDAALSLLEKGLHAIVDAVNAVVQAAIKAAQAVVEALGTWAKLIKDVASGPGAWIGKLGASVVDGIKHHLWSAFKTTVVEWFKSKVFELIGVGGLILEVLLEGGITQADIIEMALAALIVAIPAALIMILIEKLVSMIIPAAGALMAIIEGLQAAWGTISRIIVAFAAFMAFLLAVKGGGAGPLFATALAAAAVVLLDFVANWLLRKLRGPASKVGKRLEAMAAKLKQRRKNKPNKPKDRDAGAPRRDKPDDGSRPRTDKPDRPKKKRDDDRDNKRDGNDKAQALRAAQAAARKGWSDAKRSASREVLSGGELRMVLSRAAKATAKARVQVKHEERGETWQVDADAVVGKARASAKAGHGWVAKSKTGQSFYAASNMASFNRRLIDEALGQLRREETKKAPDLRKAYDEKVAEGRRLEQKQQGALDRRVRGLTFEIEMEPFSGAEKDEKIRTTASVAPNKTEETTQVPIEADFADRFRPSEPKPGTQVKKVRRQQSHMRPLKKPPFLSASEKLGPGYVVNMAATPKEVRPNAARRYFSDAWGGSDRADLAKLRTAVVMGVNSYRSIARHEEDKKTESVESSIGSVEHVAKTLMGVFGFLWEPRWTETGRGEVAFEHVRAEWNKLPADKKGDAELKAAEASRIREALPYGAFRNQLTESPLTKEATSRLVRVTDPVHVISQDADGGVVGQDDGILTEYDKFLQDIGRHPLLTIGGYRFAGFDWGEEAGSRKQQLTELANAIDRAVRAAIGRVFPEMLYPTEPNMLIKARDARHRDGIYDRGIEEGMWGDRPAEGREAGRTIADANAASRNPHEQPVRYAPSTSPVSSPTPENRDRGLTVDADHVRAELDAGGHPFDAVREQSQNPIKGKRLAHELESATDTRVPKSVRTMMSRPEQLGAELVDDPGKQVDLDAENARVDDKADQVKRARSARPMSEEDKARVNAMVDRAAAVTKEIIAALSSDELRHVWRELSAVLKQIESERTAQARPPTTR